jgi:hypothetical protein
VVRLGLASEAEAVGIRFFLRLFLIGLSLHLSLLDLLDPLNNSLITIFNDLVDFHVGAWVLSHEAWLSHAIPVSGEEDVPFLATDGEAF